MYLIFPALFFLSLYFMYRWMKRKSDQRVQRYRDLIEYEQKKAEFEVEIREQMLGRLYRGEKPLRYLKHKPERKK